MTELSSNYSERLIKTLKAGHSVLSIAGPENYGELLTEIVKLFVPEAAEGSPRAIILVANDDDAKAYHEAMAKAVKALDLTVDLVFEKGSKLKQRNDLFDGTEIIIGTTRRVCELYFQNGFNIGKLKLFVILQIDEQIRAGSKGYISRLAESLPKCRQLVFSRVEDEERLNDYMETFIGNYQVVEA
jgi:superfamily II DNA/RNA helicase